MFRLLIIIAFIPIFITFVLRWWFGMRLLAVNAQQQCSCDLNKWHQTFGPTNMPVSEKGDAIIYADLLRQSALADWKTRDAKSAASREAVRRFGTIVPPLALMIAVLGMIVGRIPAAGAISIFLLALAFAAVISYLGISTELKAILITNRRLRSTRIFPRSDDEKTVIALATALAWKEAAPPAYNLIQR